METRGLHESLHGRSRCPDTKRPATDEGAGRDGDVGAAGTSGPAPLPRGNRAGADEAGLLARGAVAGLPGALSPVAGGAAAVGRFRPVLLQWRGPARLPPGLPGGPAGAGPILG